MEIKEKILMIEDEKGICNFITTVLSSHGYEPLTAYTSSMMPNGRFQAGALVIDYNKYCVYINDADAGLTQNEFKLVALLGKNAGRVLTYDTIMRELWGPNAGEYNQILRVNMANIRRKIEKNPATPQYIFTEIGVGYRMVSGDELS